MQPRGKLRLPRILFIQFAFVVVKAGFCRHCTAFIVLSRTREMAGERKKVKSGGVEAEEE